MKSLHLSQPRGAKQAWHWQPIEVVPGQRTPQTLREMERARSPLWLWTNAASSRSRHRGVEELRSMLSGTAISRLSTERDLVTEACEAREWKLVTCSSDCLREISGKLLFWNYANMNVHTHTHTHTHTHHVRMYGHTYTLMHMYTESTYCAGRMRTDWTVTAWPEL